MRIFAAFLLFTLHSTISLAGNWTCEVFTTVRAPFDPKGSQDEQSLALAFPACEKAFFEICVPACHEAGGEFIPQPPGYKHTDQYKCGKNAETGGGTYYTLPLLAAADKKDEIVVTAKLSAICAIIGDFEGKGRPEILPKSEPPMIPPADGNNATSGGAPIPTTTPEP